MTVPQQHGKKPFSFRVEGKGEIYYIFREQSSECWSKIMFTIFSEARVAPSWVPDDWQTALKEVTIPSQAPEK